MMFRHVLAATLIVSAAVPAAHAAKPKEIYKRVGKGVVLVFATDGSAQGSAGTGSIITSDGQVITNAHVVAHDGKPFKRLFIYLKPDKLAGSMQEDLKQRYEAALVDIDHQLDLALLKMKAPPADLTVIPFADPDEVEIGDDVVAIGHPETAGLWTLTTGVISSVVKDFQGVNGKDVFQTEASINRGNSGGPLLNDEGQMVAINTCISRRAADGLAITDINFSLKSSVPVEWMKRKDLMTLAYVKRGLDGQPVAQAEPEKPAAPAIAAKPSKPEKKPITVKSDDGTIVAVVEPEKGEEVAEDPEFGAGEQTEQVSNTRALPQGQKAAPVKQEPEKKPEAKILTKARPYKMDPFVQARLKEIKALEDIMDESRQKIRQKSGKKSGGKGLGLW